MVSLTSLWLPIVISAVVVFIASFAIHMVFRYHMTDFRRLPAENDVMDALRRFNLTPGDYMAPHPQSMKHIQTKEFDEARKRGPVFVMTVWPSGDFSMAPQMAQWLVFCLVVSTFAGYIASRSLGPGAEYLRVSQMASTTAFLGYALAQWSTVIWYRKSAMTTLKNTLDGLIFGLLTGGVFGWLWPK